MITSYTVTVTEVDDSKEAVRQATERAKALPLRKNTLGVVTAHPEFVPSGVCCDVARALPFPTIGMTSISHCAGGAAETYMLSILILTSDDCEFSHGLSGVMAEDSSAGVVEEAVRKCYEEARVRLGGEPRLALVCAPYSHQPRHCDYIAAVSKLDGRLPVFGAVCNDDKQNQLPRTNARVFYCGECYEDRLAMVLVSGDVAPKFHIASVTDEAMIMPRVGVITKAVGNKLFEVNNVSATEFFRGVGFLAAGPVATREGLLSSLFVMHKEDGTSITHIPFQVDDDGIRCGGKLTEGAAISVAFNTKDSVMETARRIAEAVRNDGDGKTAIIHSCLGRRYGLLGEPMAELELIRDSLDGAGPEFNYVASYATGEMCPTKVTDDRAFNQDHSQTIVACVF